MGLSNEPTQAQIPSFYTYKYGSSYPLKRGRGGEVGRAQDLKEEFSQSVLAIFKGVLEYSRRSCNIQGVFRAKITSNQAFDSELRP